jgi:hypothetical protein
MRTAAGERAGLRLSLLEDLMFIEILGKRSGLNQPTLGLLPFGSAPRASRAPRGAEALAFRQLFYRISTEKESVPRPSSPNF